MSTQSHTNKLINIDNGGTLTDICVIDGAQVWRTKTVTTPYDLSKCLFEGLKKAARSIYGDDDVQRLLLSTDCIRYSTTQGTNALVERKGPQLGLVLGGALDVAKLTAEAQAASLFMTLVGDRAVAIDSEADDEAFESAATRAVTGLSSAGASRIVVAFGGTRGRDTERRLKRVLLKKFPQHLLGAVPILYTSEVAVDADDVRRTWTALLNAFLHPAMERFLYSAEAKLRDYKTRNPLLIFRNDGHSARVAKTIAVKTYSSGPRGGAEGSRALATHYGFGHLVSMDIGGTTTDIGEVRERTIRADRYGKIESVTTSFALCDVESHGVGGSSVIRVEQGHVVVGPESVGSAPGPACFGFGGTLATITDAFLVSGLLDPNSYFGGELRIDTDRARTAIEEHVATLLGCPVDAAVVAMEAAWVGKVAAAISSYTSICAETTLAAFGGAGPFVVCRIADELGVSRVLIPGLAAVFSAFGIGFSDIAHEYAIPLRDGTGLQIAREQLRQRALHGMFAEGIDLADCRLQFVLQDVQGNEHALGADGASIPTDSDLSGDLVLVLNVVKPIIHATLDGRFDVARRVAASAAGQRRIRVGGSEFDAPLYRVEEQAAGASAAGPAVLEEAFFTCRIDPGWQFEINAARDILLTRMAEQ